MVMTWFRYHADVLNNKRVQKLPAELFKFWVNLQCILTIEDAPASGKIPPVEDCAYFLRLSVQETTRNLQLLSTAGLLKTRNETVNETQSETKCNDLVKQSETKCTVSGDENGTLFETQETSYFLNNWGKKQYKSDTSTERVKRFREKNKTVPETPTDTDTDQSRYRSEQKGGLDFSNFNISEHLDGKALEWAKGNAPGWSIDYLMKHYNLKIHKGEWRIPDKPGAAFASWCKSFTKGKPPQ